MESSKRYYNHSHVKPGIKKTVLILLPLLLVIGPFLITPILNNVKNQRYLDRLLRTDLPAGTNRIGNRHYIRSNRGDCVHFVGVSMVTSAPVGELSEFWQKADGTLFPNGIDVIWQEPGGDSVVLIPAGLHPQKLTAPVNLSFYGSDVNSGINRLLTEGAEHTNPRQRLVVLFTTFQASNIFDYRCY